ncbi:EAL domain-containing protein [uncultured Ferrimonas sp.]|uniref:EAL domain-containing protein n=1 Tax=uncultured Ferrimonas sp. TaxID=432640 RepID=UPI002614FE85|nr:EAL domain-containing protein [uncultured Ferrimonas sp.]
MTLFRVLLLGLVLLISVISAASIGIYLRASQQFLAQQLAAHGQDTATSLGLSLTPVLSQPDWVLAQSLLDSIFDQGDFTYIRLQSIDGSQRLQRQRPASERQVPAWFDRALPLQAPIMRSDVNGQWRLVATVEVQVSVAASKRLLWHICQQALLAALVIASLALLFGSWLLRRLLRPLQLAEQQANGLRRHRYLRQAHLPRIREMASLVRTMNLMVDNSEAMFKQQCVRMERLRKQTLQDDETGLGNLSRYRQRLEQALKDREHQGGVVVKLHLTGMDKVELKGGIGGEQTLLEKIAALLHELALQLPQGRAYRIGFADFILLFPGVAGHDVAELESNTRQQLSVLLRQAGGERVLMAACDYQLDQTSTELEQRLEQTLSDALGSAAMSVFQYHPSEQPPLLLAAQGELLNKLLTTPPRLLAQPVQDRNGQVLHQELLTRFSDGKRWYNPAPVMAMVARQQCFKQFDLWVLTALLERLKLRQHRYPVSCNLTAESVLDPLLSGQLQRRLRHHWSQLALEIPERALLIDAELTQRFISTMSQAGARLWLDHTTPSGMVLMAQPGLEGIKLDPGYTRALLTDSGSSDLIEMMIAAAHSRGIKVVAQQVEEPELAQKLWQLGIDGVQGFGVGELRPFSAADGPVALK